MTQGVAMGYGADLAGWLAETAFAEGGFATMDLQTLEGFGKVIDFDFGVTVDRQNIRGVKYQKRQNDPIVSETFELSVSALWQFDATNSTIFDILDDILSNEGDSRNSYCIKIQAKPDGLTEEFLYLTGCTINTFSIGFSLDDTIKVDLTFDVANIDDGTETSPPRDWGATDSGTDPTNSSSDPTTYSEADFTTWGIAPDIKAELQDFSVDYGVNPILIKNYTSKSHINQAQGAIDIGFSGSVFGDGTSMGSSALINAVLADSSGNIVVSIDGTKVLTLTAGSYDSVTVPIKEVDLTVIDFEGEGNNLAIA